MQKPTIAPQTPPDNVPPQAPMVPSATLAPLQQHALEGFAHDINNWLLVIQNTLEAAWPTPTLLRERQAIDTIQHAIIKARTLACDIMSSGIQPHHHTQTPLYPQPYLLSLIPLLKGVLTPNTHLYFDIKQNLPPIQIDTASMGDALLNLVKNASEAYEEKEGDIFLHAEPYTLSSQALPDFQFRNCTPKPGHGVRLRIQDRGPGFDLQSLMASTSTSTKKGGHGIGLNNVVSTIQAHQGGLCVQSTPGRGSCFSIWLPETTEAVTELPPKPIAASTSLIQQTFTPSSRKLRVLMLDDDPAILQSTALLLTSIHAEPILADTQSGAYNLFIENQATLGLILLDADVERMSTRPLLERFRQINDTIPYVIVSGYAESKIKEIFGDNLYNGFLGKPYTRADLQSLIARVINT